MLNRAIRALCVTLFLASPSSLSAQVSVTTLESTYSQNFDAAAFQSSGTWTDNTTFAGWYAQFGTNATNPTAYTASTGNSGTGALYSFGSAAVPADRALGSVGSGTPTDIYWAVRLVNNTGSAITSLDVSFVGEQWRQGGCTPTPCTPAAQVVDFQYQVANAGVITDANAPTGSWVDHNALDFTSPQPGTSTAAAIDGNAAANRTNLASTITVTVNPGQEIWLRWRDINHANNDHGLATDGLAVTVHGAPATPTLNIDDVTVTEGNAGPVTASFTVSLSIPAPGNVTFDIATADNTATVADNDYVARSLSHTITAGNQTYTFDVTVNGDMNLEPTETFLVNVTNVAGATVNDGQGQGTITTDDVPPQLSIADPAPQNEGNAGTTTMTFTVTLDAPAPPGGVTFDIATADGTATDADNDYEPNAIIGTASIAQGGTTYNFPVTINGDTKFEADESFGVTVTNVVGATVSDNGAVGTIDNDDAPPALAIASAALLEGNGGTQTLTFTVTMTGTAGANVTVDWATSDSSATAGDADYVADSGTLTFVPGDSTETFDVTINGDTNIEGDEQFFVTLSNPTGGAVITNTGASPNPALGIIKSDDAFSLAATNTPYTQNFDALASSDAANSRAATTPATWTFAESGTAADLVYRPSNGTTNSGNAGDTYSFGPSGNTDRAFGTLLSGSNTPTIGGQFVNNTGEAITTLSIAYTGEQWRLGATGRADRLDFQYSTSATSLTTGTWTHVDALDFTSPFTSSNSADVGARDGNAAPNRTNVAYTIGGLNIPIGATFWIRWTDFNASGADDGLSVDDFSLIANIAGGVFTISDATVTEGNAGTVTASFTVTLSQAAGVGGVTFDIATADNTATVADNDYVARSETGVNIAEGSTQYTFDVTVNGDTNVENSETFFVNVTNLGGAAPNDLQGLGTIGSDDFVFTKISVIQGDGNVSPLNGSTNITIGGIVTGIKSGGSGGFFVQEEVADYDSDSNTSEAIFVFTGGSLPAGVAIGNTVAVTGTVSEFPSSAIPHAVTELTSVTVNPLGNPQPLPAPVVLTAADGAPSSNISQYERYEGMRVTASLTVVSPTQGSVDEVNATSTSNGVFYGVITGTPRPFREIGIEQTAVVPSEAACPACIDRFDMNPEKLRVDSDNQPGATQLNVAAGQTVTNIVGPLDFGFFEYTILPEAETVPVVAGDSTFDPVRARTASELTVSSFNLERFYDTVNDDDDPGPADGISDVILTPAAFNNRLNKASLAIRNALLNPDVIGVVEVDNLPTLQALAAKVNTDNGGSTNYVAYLEEGNDVGGIDVGYLVNENRVTTGSVTQIGKTATFVDPSDSSVDLLNDRPSLVLEASIARPDSSIYDFVVVVNHLRSLNGVDTNDAGGQRVRAKRAAQAEYLANYVQGRQTTDPAERIILVGDFNAFEFHDGYVDMMGTIVGNPAPATEVVRASPDLVDPNLINLVLTVPAAERYSYNFDGNAQVLDHAVTNVAMYPTFVELLYAHLDSDFPETFRSDPNRPERISDHDAPVAYFSLAPEPEISIADNSGSEASTPLSFTVTLDSPSLVPVTVDYTTSDGTAVAPGDYTAQNGTVTFIPGDVSETIDITIVNDTMFEGSENFTITLSNPSIGSSIADGTATGTITDNDTQPTISISDLTNVTETDATQTVNVPVTLSNPSAFTITVNYTTDNSFGGAAPGNDYVSESGTVTFLPGETTQNITIDILGDDVFEGSGGISQFFRVLLSNPTNATISDSDSTITIYDDDAIPFVTISDAEVTETDGTIVMTFNLTLDRQTELGAEFTYSTFDTTATAGSDYVAEMGTVSFLSGEMSKTITIDILGDDIDEGTETFRVEAIAPPDFSRYGFADSEAIGTITDDEPTPSVSIADNSVVETDGTTSISFTVTLSGASSSTVTVDYATSDGSATAGADYTAETGTVTFTAGDVSETITIDVLGDDVAEGTEAFNVTLSNVSASATINDATATGTINDDEPTPSVSIADNSVIETDATTTISFTVTLSGASDETVTVDYATSDGSATAGADYTGETGTLTFVAGDVSETITIDVLGDDTAEGTEAFTVTLSNVSAAATVNDGEATGTIFDDEGTPTLVITDNSVTETDGTTTISFNVALTGAVQDEVTVDYATSNGSATAGSDYTAETGTLTFAPGDLSETITIDVLGDDALEGTETFLVTLSNNSAGASIGDGEATGTINDDEPVLSLTIDDQTVTETNGTVTMTVTVTLTGTNTSNVTVDYATAGNTATGGADFTAENGTLTFVPGDATETITIDVLGDNIYEETETFFINLSNPSANAVIGDNQAIGTINDDEPVPTISIGDSLVVENSFQTSVGVQLSGPASAPVTVTYTTADGTATSPADYSAATGQLTFNPGEVMKFLPGIPIVDDNIVEGSEVFHVILSNPSANATLGRAEGNLFLSDSEQAPTVTIADASATETDATSTMTFTVALNYSTTSTVTVHYATAGDSATSGSDFTATSGIVTFAPGDISETITVDILGDNVAEGTEAFTVTLDTATNALVSPNESAIGTIFDDETDPVLIISDQSVTETNGATTITFNVSLSGAAAGTVTVDYATSNGTATAGTDYTAETGTLTFAPGDVSETITIDILGDTALEADETFLVTLSNVTGGASIGDAEATGTILNDDAAVAALTVTKSVSPQTATFGQNVTYTIVVTNNGPQSATAVAVTDDLPAGMTFVSANSTQGTCNTADPVVCTIGTLANGASATVTIVAQLPFTVGTFGNTASVNSDESVTAVSSTTANVVITGPSHGGNIPTLSEWALFALMAMLAGIAVMRMR